ncbi:MAG: hypothetical protein AAF799_03290 [Myxococcota bacterium]
MQLRVWPSLLVTTLATLTATGCKTDGSSNAPSALEQAADDISYEADHAGETVEQLGSDMRDAAEQVADSVRGDEGSADDTTSPDPDDESASGEASAEAAGPDSE